MSTKRKSSLSATPSTDGAKVAKEKDIDKVLRYFSLYVGTTLDAERATGVMRSSICYYVSDLQELGLLQWIYRSPDRTTHRKAKYYTADRSLWRNKKPQQLDLFGKEVRNG